MRVLTGLIELARDAWRSWEERWWAVLGFGFGMLILSAVAGRGFFGSVELTIGSALLAVFVTWLFGRALFGLERVAFAIGTAASLALIYLVAGMPGVGEFASSLLWGPEGFAGLLR